MQSYQSGDWIVHTCANCGIDTHVTHRVKGDNKTFITNKVEVGIIYNLIQVSTEMYKYVNCVLLWLAYFIFCLVTIFEYIESLPYWLLIVITSMTLTLVVELPDQLFTLFSSHICQLNSLSQHGFITCIPSA